MRLQILPLPGRVAFSCVAGALMVACGSTGSTSTTNAGGGGDNGVGGGTTTTTTTTDGGAPHSGGGPGSGGSECQSDTGEPEVIAADAPYVPAGCDLVGSFVLAYDPEVATAPSSFEVKVDDAGALVVLGSGLSSAEVLEGGCTLVVKWQTSDSERIDDECFSCFEDTAVTLMFTESTVTGTFEFSEYGECGSDASGNVTVTKSQ